MVGLVEAGSDLPVELLHSGRVELLHSGRVLPGVY